MNLLDNELVRKYFSCDVADCIHTVREVGATACMSWRVLQAMQGPIKKGERYLISVPRSDGINMTDMYERTLTYECISTFHPFELRLPDHFQNKECCDQYFSGSCPTCHSVHSCQPKPDPPKCDHGACFVCAVCRPEPKPDEVRRQYPSEARILQGLGLAISLECCEQLYAIRKGRA